MIRLKRAILGVKYGMTVKEQVHFAYAVDNLS
jgi:hypothetical protein